MYKKTFRLFVVGILLILFHTGGVRGENNKNPEKKVSDEQKNEDLRSLPYSIPQSSPRSFKRISNYEQTIGNPEKKFIILWCDYILNFERISNRAGICRILDRCLDTGIDAVAVPARLQIGFTTYKSQWEKKISSLPTSQLQIPEDFDLLRMFIEEGHRRNIDIFVIISLFTRGDKELGVGPYFEEKSDEVTIINDIDCGKNESKARLQSLLGLKQGMFDLSNHVLFGNPLHPEVQNRDLRILSEIIGLYDDIDGIIFDRLRYAGLDADFSGLSRREFEGFVGKKIMNYPDDIFSLVFNEETKEARIVEGKYFKEWCKWRALNIKDYLIRLINRVRATNSKLPVGCNVGAWYPEYYEVGVNWASKMFIPASKGKSGDKTFSWAEKWFSNGYEYTGFAEDIDFLLVGCYFNSLSEEEAKKSSHSEWESVEGGCRIAKEVTKGFVPLISGLDLSLYRNQPEQLSKAISIALKNSNGLKIFDLSFVEEKNLWDVLATSIEKIKF